MKSSSTFLDSSVLGSRHEAKEKHIPGELVIQF